MSNTEAKFNQSPPQKSQNKFLGAQLCLRTIAIATTLTATWFALTAKQNIELFGIAFDARYSYSPAFKFFAFANVVVCALSAISLVLIFFLRRYFFLNHTNYFILFIHDLFTLLLLLSGTVAATAIGYVGQYGNNHTGWAAICDHFAYFCKKITISIAVSFLTVVIFLVLTIISASKAREIKV